MRRILIIVGGVLLIAIVIGLGFFFRLWGGGEAPDDGTAIQSGGILPPTPNQAGGTGTFPNGQTVPSQAPETTAAGAAQKFGVVLKKPVVDYYVDEQNIIYAIQPDGQVIRVSGTTESKLSSTKI